MSFQPMHPDDIDRAERRERERVRQQAILKQERMRLTRLRNNPIIHRHWTIQVLYIVWNKITDALLHRR
jgi:hypothetical protein